MACSALEKHCQGKIARPLSVLNEDYVPHWIDISKKNKGYTHVHVHVCNHGYEKWDNNKI